MSLLPLLSCFFVLTCSCTCLVLAATRHVRSGDTNSITSCNSQLRGLLPCRAAQFAWRRAELQEIEASEAWFS